MTQSSRKWLIPAANSAFRREELWGSGALPSMGKVQEASPCDLFRPRGALNTGNSSRFCSYASYKNCPLRFRFNRLIYEVCDWSSVSLCKGCVAWWESASYSIMPCFLGAHGISIRTCCQTPEICPAGLLSCDARKGSVFRSSYESLHR